MRMLGFSIAILMLPHVAVADDYNNANRAAAFMAAVNVCKATITPEVKRTLYSRMLKIFETPSQTNYTIGVETSALNKMSPPDREAMCAAINDRIKAGVE